MSPARSPGWVPNQHGAWAMLASPLLVGVLASHPRWSQLVLAAFWFAGYFAFFATGLWLRSGRKARYLPPVRVYAVAAAVLGLATVAAEPRLLRWAPLFVLPLAIGLWSAAHRTDRSVLAGVATTLGSAGMTLVAFDAGGGTDWLRALTLAALQAGYFVGTVLYVKSLIRRRGETRYLLASVGYHAGLAATAAGLTAARLPAPGHGLGWGVVAVLAVLTVRSALVPRFSPSPAAIGAGEIVATVALAWTSLLA